MAKNGQEGTEGGKVEKDEASEQQPATDTPADTTPAQPPSDTAITVTTDTTDSPSAPPSEQPPSASTIPSAQTLSAPTAASAPSSPGKRRPKPPTKGILKPPPPPAKPTFSNRLRDIVGGAVNVVGTTTNRLFDGPEDISQHGQGQGQALGNAYQGGAGAAPGPSTPGRGGGGSSAGGPNGVNGVGQPAGGGGTLASLSGRFAGFGLGRFVAAAASPQSAPGASPMARQTSLEGAPGQPGGMGGQGVVEAGRPKQPLKRATFVLPSLSITYPISSQGEPWSVKVIEDRKRIESTHKSLLSASTGPEYWTAARLVTLYESACRGREERPRVGIVRALEVIPPAPRPRTIHIILRPIDHTTIGQPPLPPPAPNTLDIPLTRHSAEAFADVLSTEWGLGELRLEQGLVESEDALKPILHALLISGTLPMLGLAGNKKIKAAGWRLLAVFLKKAHSLKYVDLSDTVWDKKGVEYLVQALNCTHVRPPPVEPSAEPTQDVPPPGQDGEASGEGEGESREKPREDAYGAFIPLAPLLKERDQTSTPAAVQTIRMDGCGLRAAVLETLAQGVRSSDLRNISLRRNKINALGAVALALMIRDYPDSAATSLKSSASPFSSTTSLNTEPAAPLPPVAVPYAARARRGQPAAAAAAAAAAAEERDLPPIPLVVSSPAGGITSRTLPEGYRPPPPPKHPLVMPSGGNSSMQEAGNFPGLVSSVGVLAEGKMVTGGEAGGASVALQRSVRALAGVERIGRLLTLDLKSNEIRTGVNYIAQVLKRNRTLKVLNLSDNGIQPAGLAALAEALKYNSTLETLDLSSNPCCGPSSEGIAALRTAFTVNTSLKRLFLSDTGLGTEGAIALAEFLPETKSLLHLDLTANPAIDTAGILAISVGLKANKLIRCLDVSIPPNHPDLAELSQNILQSCIRNTELAAETVAREGGRQDAVWGPIKKSALVRHVKEADEARAERERVEVAQSPAGLAREYVYTLRPERVLEVSEQVAKDLQRWFDARDVYARSPAGAAHTWVPGPLPKDFVVLHERAKVLCERVVEQVQETTDMDKLERLLRLNDLLMAQLEQARGYVPPPRLLLPSEIVPTEVQVPLRGHQRAVPANLGAGWSAARGTSPSHPAGNSASASPSGTPTTQRFQRRHMRGSSLEISSPNFSIGDSDNDSDAEELDVGKLGGGRGAVSPLGEMAAKLAVAGQGGISPSPSTSTNLGGGLGFGTINTTSTSQHAIEQGLMEAQADDAAAAAGEELTSPVEKASRAWVEEEGEIFRKGTKLGVMEDEEMKESEDVSGEELRKEILDTPVARSPTRRVIPIEGEEGEGEVEGSGEGDEAAQDGARKE
ncbi:hypothetical protein IAT38_000022 [Cryptococcus sp. DSM 104549]